MQGCAAPLKNVLGIVICKMLESTFKEVILLSIFPVVFLHVLLPFRFQSLPDGVFMFSFLSQDRILSL